jgi:outer membrane lipoprotein-sorting protein
LSNPGWFLGVLDENRKATIIGSESLTVNGKQAECYVVQSDGEGISVKHDGATRETLWIDKQRFVVWQRHELTWLDNGLQEHLRIDLTTVKLEESLPKGTFTFRPPKGSKLVPVPQ